mmetsp:Transcript_58799/g.136827  ORF Transcript_58799/g.136827 Transcript_58799/m.136827 type:complete len:372 (+) Transcript_58799:75-1190(+)|eukprot:CAMPEP_0171112764 /NCGR_PEP_ID=MMETSP0766_2-20121228/80234_1 /TAXON_ID=439317 /ORGANISM="Gambierdiscus australes, Strain CAWD 149" /LENGTH=371 /DNA_ID=CAMNT_0011574909 /DNA_START=65 /DNA_END=1180 /DNA_ORIENTATION=-
MAAGLGSLLALAAGLALTGAEESKPIVIVDHITSSVYLDDRQRGKGKVGQQLRAKPPVPLVVGLTGSAIACGAVCDFVIKQGRLSLQDGADEEVWEVPVDTEDSGQPGSRLAVTRVKVSIAMLVGLIISTAMRRAARKRPVRGVAAAASERKEANDLGCIKSKKKVSVANRDNELSDDTQEIQFAGNDEPHPELEPGRAGESDVEVGNHKTDDESEDDPSTGLQPGNKGYVYKRKSEYEAKESRTNSSGDLLMSQRSSMRDTERSKRRTEYHRISTEHHLANLAGLVGAVDDDDDSRRCRRPPEFHRMHTEPQTPNEEEKEEREESVDSFVEFERRNNIVNREVNKDVGFYRIHTPQVDSKTSFYRISTEG